MRGFGAPASLPSRLWKNVENKELLRSNYQFSLYALMLSKCPTDAGSGGTVRAGGRTRLAEESSDYSQLATFFSTLPNAIQTFHAEAYTRWQYNNQNKFFRSRSFAAQQNLVALTDITLASIYLYCSRRLSLSLSVQNVHPREPAGMQIALTDRTYMYVNSSERAYSTDLKRKHSQPTISPHLSQFPPEESKHSHILPI